MNKNTFTLIPDELIEKINDRVIYHFKEICKVFPRSSKNEGKMCEYLKEFANNLIKKGLEINFQHQSEIQEGKPINNIVLTKPASKGYENFKTVALQGHSDMVCQKNKDSIHNFDTMPISIEIDEKTNVMTSKNKETTLGADNGIGIAYILAVLESTDLFHPQIQGVFTSDEEDGMSGAKWLDTKIIKSDCFINLDAEEEGTLYYGCAGGTYVNIDIPADYIKKPNDMILFNLEISGLLGGHSGMAIDKGRANANRLMGRALNYITEDFAKINDKIYLSDISGGNAKNAITKEATAIIAVKDNLKDLLAEKIIEIAKIFKYEYSSLEENLSVKLIECKDKYENILTEETLNKIITILVSFPNGVLDKHTSIKDLVETSSNLGIVQLNSNSVSFICFVRSSIESKKQFVVKQIELIAKSIGADFSADTDFPEWNPDNKSKLVNLFKNTYKECFNKEPKCESIHAGLECGYFFKKFYNSETQKSVDLIAIGPTIADVHVPQETVHIDTLKPVTKLLLNVLANIDKYDDLSNRRY